MEMSSYPAGVPSWIDLSATDPDAAADFYSKLFGWTVPPGPPEAGGYRMAELRGKLVAGIGPQLQPGMPPNWATYIASDDVDATAKAVADAGGQTLAPPMDVLDAGRMGVFADATGAAFGVWQARQHQGAQLANEPVSLAWNELATRDLDAAKAFYTSVFGWRPNTVDVGGGATYTECLLGDRSVAGLTTMDENFPPEVPAHWRVYFAVADTDATIAKVTELGGAVHVPPMDIPQGRFAAVADPQGAFFSVIALSA